MMSTYVCMYYVCMYVFYVFLLYILVTVSSYTNITLVDLPVPPKYIFNNAYFICNNPVLDTGSQPEESSHEQFHTQ